MVSPYWRLVCLHRCIFDNVRQVRQLAIIPPNSVLPTQSKKRGLSLEEKREKVLEIFHETKDVFQLKVEPKWYLCWLWSQAGLWASLQIVDVQDIEKLAPKKGVISQSVKEVLQVEAQRYQS